MQRLPLEPRNLLAGFSASIHVQEFIFFLGRGYVHHVIWKSAGLSAAPTNKLDSVDLHRKNI
jgi:hypothetical protein